MLIDEIKKRMMQAMKAKDTVAKDVLSLAAGEIQMGGVRAGRDLSDLEQMQAVRKLIKSNKETLGMTSDSAKSDALKKEISVLEALLPAKMTAEQIAAALEGQKEAIRAAKSDGQATGIAMKQLKASGAEVDSDDVAAAIKSLRG